MVSPHKVQGHSSANLNLHAAKAGGIGLFVQSRAEAGGVYHSGSVSQNRKQRHIAYLIQLTSHSLVRYRPTRRVLICLDSLDYAYQLLLFVTSHFVLLRSFGYQKTP